MFKLIAKTEINWTTLRDVLPEELKRNLYAQGVTSLFTLIKLIDPKARNFALDFASLCYYFQANEDFIYLVRSRSNLNLQTVGKGGFVTGTIRQWKDFIEITCSVYEDYEARKFGNLMYAEFLKLDLGTLFGPRTEYPDNTFLLGPKQ